MYTNGIVAGWYGSTILIGDNEYSLGNVYQETISFCADISECVAVSAGGGIQQYNIGWTINADEEEVLAGSAPFLGEIGNCTIYGCMDETACNYNSKCYRVMMVHVHMLVLIMIVMEFVLMMMEMEFVILMK